MQIVKPGSAGSLLEHVEQAAQVLRQGGLVCFPCQGKYRLAADLTNPDAVTALFQSKRRVGKSPALVFVANEEMLGVVAADVDDAARSLVKRFWPGRLTILFDASDSLPKKVRKQILRGNGQVGVRVPDDAFAKALVEAFGGPLLVSSANREKKAGATSAAQVKKNFVHRVELFVDAGDLRSEPPSTVVELGDGEVRVTRPGVISPETLRG